MSFEFLRHNILQLTDSVCLELINVISKNENIKNVYKVVAPNQNLENIIQYIIYKKNEDQENDSE